MKANCISESRLAISAYLLVLALVSFAILSAESARGQKAGNQPIVTLPGGSAVPGSDGNSLFAPTVSYKTGGSEAGFVAVADVNGDGIPDILATNTYVSDTIGVLLGNGDGTFSKPKRVKSGGGYPASIVPFDINKDGKMDLIVLNQGQCYACSGDGSVAILLGKGNGGFRKAVTYDAGGLGNGVLGPSHLAVVDVNGDGKPDIVVVNCAPSGSSGCSDGNGVVGVLLGNGDGTFQNVVTYDSGSSAGDGLAVADVNGDGKPDILVTSGCTTPATCTPGGIEILFGNGDGTFRPAQPFDTGGWSASGIVVADVNGDGKPDIVVGGCGAACLSSDGLVTVLLGKGDGTFEPGVPYDSGAPFADGFSVADINGDGKLDIVVADTWASLAAVLLGNGDGSFQAPQTYSSGGTFAYGVAIADLNGDGKPDVVISNCGNKGGCGFGVRGMVGVLLSK